MTLQPNLKQIKLLQQEIAQLKKREQQYHTIFECSKNPILLIKNNCYIDCNQAALDALRISSKEALRKTKPSSISPKYQPCGRLSEEKQYEMMNMAVKNGSHTFEWVHINSVSDNIWFDVSLTKTIINGEMHLCTNLKDITKRKLTEQALKESEEKHKTIVNLIGEGLGITDFKENIVYANKPAEQIFGVKHGSLVGRNLKEFLTQDQTKIIREQTTNRKSGRTSSYEVILTCHNRKTKNILLTAAPSYNSERKIIGSLAVFRDITKMKENEQALINANATKDKFFNILAHDLRSPFSSILGFSKLLQENHKNYDTEQRVQLIKPIVDSTQKTFELLENLLEWARSQSGQITLNPDYYELQLLIDEIINIAEGAAKNKKVNLISAITEKISVYIDEEIVKTILRNLITNAIKFTPKGGTVNINAIQCNEIITVSISDTGVGISKEKQNSLFDLTKKTTTKGTNGETGSGLGLILCKEFVEKQDGNIWVESELGKGSTFYFTIPNKKCEY